MAIFGLVGAGGMGREAISLIADSIALCRPDLDPEKQDIIFLESNPDARTVNGFKVWSVDEFAATSEERYFNIAIGEPETRARLAPEIEASGAIPFNIIHPQTEIRGSAQIGPGAFIGFETVVTTDVRVGRFFQSNHASFIGPGTTIGDHVTFSPRIYCSGHVTVGDQATIGTGARIQGGTHEKPLQIGREAIIGMGAIITEDIPPGAVVVGNPGRVIRQNDLGET